ncbi:DNA repair helicase XPB [Gracilinema caldarium]|uniref:DNA 3'-5' helicase n=1 Tax=Gracilinema caldarium (strain ATCC 51460 / DSM 7334 / H1) TaxID=744872 RepID=F8EXY5_GRAC1|nr:DNA repair helicase XPB [Gracilinema caldarium]AEJ20646.1 type III restriction protein res subunit [Gracilinema caldarium DSM 7334]
MANPANPLIIQSDRTLLMDVHAEGAEEARSAIMPFAELVKSPEHIHTYQITPLSLWNAASAGLSPQDIQRVLEAYSRYPVPRNILEGFADTMARYGKIKLVAPEHPPQQAPEQAPPQAVPQQTASQAGTGPGSNSATTPAECSAGAQTDTLLLLCESEPIRAEVAAAKSLAKYLIPDGPAFRLKLVDRGTVKRELIKLGWPVQDLAPLAAGEPLEINFRTTTSGGKPFAPRDYQVEAARSVVGDGGPGSGFGVVVLPCGSGKTVVGMTVMTMLKTNTLILTTNVAAVHQWIDELLDKTDLTAEQIAEYTGDEKSVAPVTVATYQILTWRPNKDADFPHFKLFRERAWGLIIYDEVHMLPAPVFRVTAELQAVRRLGLTATLVREDGAEDAVFSLVGPKRYDVPWKDLEAKGWIAEALCTEIRLDLPEQLKIPYAVANQRAKYRIASENPLKIAVVQQLIENHPEDRILVIGQYLSQLSELARILKVPLITGQTPHAEREVIYHRFKQGELRLIVVSKVANFAIDLPDASMAIQVSGSFGSRQEEAQRLGRILRPKNRNSYFYTIVSRFTVEEEFAANRQKFLAEQGYKYTIQHWTEDELS